MSDQSLLDDLKLIGGQPGVKRKPFTCQNCDMSPATKWCPKCEIDYCNACDSTIHAPKATSNHQRVPMTNKPKGYVLSKCYAHGRDDEIYSSECKALMCVICVIGHQDKGHSFVSSVQYAEMRRGELVSCVSPFLDFRALEDFEKDQRVYLRNDEEQLKMLEQQVLNLRNRISLTQENIQNVNKRREKVKTTEVLLKHSIQELEVISLLDNNKVYQMKQKIQSILREIYPEADKEGSERDRIEKEKTEKEREARKMYWVITNQIYCDISNFRRTIVNSNPSYWMNIPIYEDTLKTGRYCFTFMLHSAKPKTTFEIGVCPVSDWNEVDCGTSGARRVGFLYSWNGGAGSHFGRGSWTIHGGYLPGQRVQMKIDMDQGEMEFVLFPKGTLLAKCSGISQAVVPFASIASLEHNVKVTLEQFQNLSNTI